MVSHSMATSMDSSTDTTASSKATALHSKASTARLECLAVLQKGIVALDQPS